MQSDAPKNPSLNLHEDLTIRRRLALAWLALAWERLWARLWVAAALIGVFVAVVLTDVEHGAKHQSQSVQRGHQLQHVRFRDDIVGRRQHDASTDLKRRSFRCDQVIMHQSLELTVVLEVVVICDRKETTKIVVT